MQNFSIWSTLRSRSIAEIWEFWLHSCMEYAPWKKICFFIDISIDVWNFDWNWWNDTKSDIWSVWILRLFHQVIDSQLSHQTLKIFTDIYIHNVDAKPKFSSRKPKTVSFSTKFGMVRWCIYSLIAIYTFVISLFFLCHPLFIQVFPWGIQMYHLYIYFNFTCSIHFVEFNLSSWMYFHQWNRNVIVNICLNSTGFT